MRQQFAVEPIAPGRSYDEFGSVTADSAPFVDQIADAGPYAPSPYAPPPYESSGRLATLALTIERDIIPRLIAAHRSAADRSLAERSSPVPAGPQAVTAEEVSEFAALILADRVGTRIAAYTDAIGRRVRSVEALFIGLLGPAAVHLGDLWSADTVAFTDVMVALGRLQHLLRNLSPVFQNEAAPAQSSRRVLLATTPGEQHTFGLAMLSEFFVRAGWDVSGGPMASDRDLIMHIGGDWFDVVGLSSGCESRFDVVATSIAALRAASRNPAIGVMVGGPMFIAQPEMVALVGADGTALSAQYAPEAAEAMLARRAARW